jgi:hypothetical protein
MTWRIEHDVPGRETRAVIRHGGPSPAQGAVPPIEQWYWGTVGVSADDPGRAYVDSGSSYELRFPEATVRTESRMRIDSDADAYHVRIDVEAGEGDETTWSRRWERRIPRRLQ